MVFVSKEEMEERQRMAAPPTQQQMPLQTPIISPDMTMAILKKQKGQIKDLQKTLSDLQSSSSRIDSSSSSKENDQIIQNYLALLAENQQLQKNSVRANLADAVVAEAPSPKLSWWKENTIYILAGNANLAIIGY